MTAAAKGSGALPAGIAPTPAASAAREGLDLGRRHRPAVVGARSRQARGRFDGVEPAHRARPGAAARREVAHVAGHRGSAPQEVALERDDDLRVGEGVDRLEVLPEGQARPRVDVLAAGGLPGDPLRRRKLREDGGDLRGERRRGDRARQDAQARPLRGPLLLERHAQGGVEGAPGPDLAALGQGLRPVGVVHVEDESLREDVGAAEARRVELVALDLDGPALVALDEDAPRVAAVEVGRRVVEGLARNDLLGRLDVGVDALGRLPRAAGQARERDRGAHERQQLAAVDAGVDRHAELAVEVLAEVLRVEELLDRAPVLAPLDRLETLAGRREVQFLRPFCAHRWHVVQSVSSIAGRMRYSAASFGPISSWRPAGT